MCPFPIYPPGSEVRSLGWGTSAPIRKLDPQQAKNAGEWLAWVATGLKDDHLQTKDSVRNPDEKKEAKNLKYYNRYRDRLYDTKERAEDALKSAPKDEHDFYSYILCGRVVGLISIGKDIKDGSLVVDNLVGHPQCRNVGDILIEHAVQASDSMGGGGRLNLYSLPSAGNFYTSIGFTGACEQGHPGPSALDPSAAGQWTKVDGIWKLHQIWLSRNDDKDNQYIEKCDAGKSYLSGDNDYKNIDGNEVT